MSRCTPLPWPKNQPVGVIGKNSDDKYYVFLFGVTDTYVTKGALRLISKEENRYTYNADLTTGAHLFDTLEDAEFAYLSYCKLNERTIGHGRINRNEAGVVKEYHLSEQVPEITKKDVQDWIDSYIKAGKKSPIEKIGLVKGGLYYLGNGVYGGRKAWEKYCKPLKEKCKI